MHMRATAHKEMVILAPSEQGRLCIEGQEGGGRDRVTKSRKAAMSLCTLVHRVIRSCRFTLFLKQSFLFVLHTLTLGVSGAEKNGIEAHSDSRC